MAVPRESLANLTLIESTPAQDSAWSWEKVLSYAEGDFLSILQVGKGQGASAPRPRVFTQVNLSRIEVYGTLSGGAALKLLARS